MKRNLQKTELIKTEYAKIKPGHVLASRYFYFETRTNTDSDLAIVYGGYERCAGDFETFRKTYPYHVLEFGIAGRSLLEINDETHYIERNVLAGFSPGDSHHYCCDHDEPLEHIFIAFAGTEAHKLFKLSNITSQGAITAYDSVETQMLIEKIFYTGLEKSEYAQQICSNYLRILLLNQAGAKSKTGKPFSISRATFERCKRYIDQNFSWIQKTKEVSDACGINIRYMSRLFKKFDYPNPYDYIMRLKLNRAANLLFTTDLKVKEVGFEIGFEDPYHFSRNFKRFHGLSPENYRNKCILK